MTQQTETSAAAHGGGSSAPGHSQGLQVWHILQEGKNVFPSSPPTGKSAATIGDLHGWRTLVDRPALGKGENPLAKP